MAGGLLSNLLRRPARVAAVGGVTFIQLVRMRLFVALAVFAFGFLGLQFLPYQENLGIEFQGVGQLQLIKDVGVGCMQLFGLVFCVSATALLIPRDSEDRILYTILCKPVPRFDYLAGKALGVLGLLFLSLVLMDGMMCMVLQVRGSGMEAELRNALAARGMGDADMVPYIAQVREACSTWNVQRGIACMGLGLGVLTTLTLLISCCTSGTIVSIIFGLGAYVIGSFQHVFFQAISNGRGMSEELLWVAQGVSILLPDFRLFAVADAVSAGSPLGWSMLGQLALIASGYMVLHVAVAAWIFSRKEF